jgi:UDP-MurNAc hydroxylase
MIRSIRAGSGMEVKFLRGATVAFSDGNRKLICDPWLVDGIYYGSWAHYPAYTEEDWKEDRPDDVDYIYVSHIHPDHFDPNTLKRLNPEAKILIHSYAQKFLKAKIDALGFETIELENGDEFDMGSGFKIRVFAADDCDPTKCGVFFGCAGKSTQIDSLAVISTPTTNVVNANDAPWGLSYKLARALGDDYRVDLACLAHGLAGAFPQCFVGTNEWRAHCANLRAAETLRLMLKWMTALRTRTVLPFAAGYVLAGPLAYLNNVRGIPSVANAAQLLREVGATPVGNTLDYGGMDEYVSNVLRTRKLDYEDDPFPAQQELADLVPAAFARFDKHRQEMDFKGKNTINIKIGEEWFVIPPEGEGALSCSPHTQEPYMSIVADPRLLKWLLSGPKHAHWNNAEIGSHLTFDLKGPRELALSLLMSYFHA